MSLTPTQLSELQTIVLDLGDNLPDSSDALWEAAIRIQKAGLGPVTGPGGQPVFDTTVAEIVLCADQIATVQGRQGGPGNSVAEATFQVVPVEDNLPAGALGDVIYLSALPNTFLSTDVVNLTPAGPNSVVLSEIGTQVVRTLAAASGGLEVNNLATGGGFERVLTTADIGGGGITVEDEGAPLATLADTLDFVGAGVVASGAGTTKTITIAGEVVPAGTLANASLRWSGAAWVEETRVQIVGGNLQVTDATFAQQLAIRINAGNAEFSTANITDIQMGAGIAGVIALNAPVELGLSSTLFMEERAAALADVAGQGQFWVRDDVPNVPMFTDDAGTDFVLNATGSGDVVGPASSVSDRLVIFDGVTGKLIKDSTTITVTGVTLDSATGITLSNSGNPRLSAQTTGIGVFGTTIDVLETAGPSFMNNRMRNTFGGVNFRLTATGDAELVQTNAAGTIEESWIEMEKNGAVSLYNNGQRVTETTQFGQAVRGIAGATNTRIEFYDTLDPAATRRAVIGSQGLNQFDIGDDLINRPIRIYTTRTGPTIQPIIIGSPSGDTLLQGNTGIRLQTVTGVIDFRTPSIRFSMNSAGQLNLLGNGTQSGVLNVTEGTGSFGSVAGEGQFWVRDDVPNVPMFTDDAGTDFVLNLAGVPASTQASSVLRGDGGGGYVEETDLTISAAGSLSTDGTVSVSDGTDNLTWAAAAGVTTFQPTGGMNILDFNIGNVKFDGSVFLGERASALADVTGEGQLWVRTDTFSNTLMFTNDNGNDMEVMGIPLNGDSLDGTLLLTGTGFVGAVNLGPKPDSFYMLHFAGAVAAPAADDVKLQLTVDTNSLFLGTFIDGNGQVTELRSNIGTVVTNTVVVSTDGSTLPNGGDTFSITGILHTGATAPGTLSLRAAKNADTGADGGIYFPAGAVQFIQP